MRTATLITGLVTQSVRVGSFNDVARYHQVQEMRLAPISDDEAISTPITVTEHIVPITQFCRPGRPDIYIAYSHEVEDLLGVPIRVLLKEKDEAYSEMNRLRSLSGWQHILLAWRSWKLKLLTLIKTGTP